MIRWFMIVHLLLAAGIGSAEPPPAIRVPAVALPKAPDPVPGSVVLLGAEELYPVESDSPLAIRCFPQGRIKFEKGEPGTYYGKFAGGGGKWEKRVLKGPNVYVGTAQSAGRAELVFIPLGFKNESEILDAKVDCLTAPQPPPVPPTPPDPPGPKVEKSPWDDAPGLRVLIVYPKRGSLPADQQTIITGAKVRKFLDENTAKEGGEPAYWILKTDEDVTGLTPAWQKAYATTKGDKWVVVGNGPKWEATALPENPDKMLELLGRYK